MTQKERQERSREMIYQAALQEFGTYGYDGVNMEGICGRHGISKGMMYHYFFPEGTTCFCLCVDRTFRICRRTLRRRRLVRKKEIRWTRCESIL